VKAGPVAAAVVLAGFLVLRRRHLEPTLLVGGVLGIVGLLVYGSGVVELPDLETVIEDAGEFLGAWTYLVVPVLAFFETGAFIGLLTPGETFMVFGGVVAGQGRVDLAALIALTWTAAVAGDVASFYLGRRLGRQFLERHGPKVSITPERLDQVDRFYDRHGGKAVLLGRFVGLVRAVSPFLAGSGGMAFRRFLPYDVLGAGLWSATFLTLGYVFWQNFGDVLHYAEQGAFALGSTICATIAVVWLVRNRRRVARWLDAQLDRPALRPVGRVLRPLWRGTAAPRQFVWQRVTPGELGLEVTTLLAIAFVGAFAFLAPLDALRDGDVPTGDARAFSIVADLRAPWLDDLARTLTDVGDLLVVLPVGAVTVALLLWRRAVADVLVLVAGTATTYLVVQLVKDLEDRARPTGALVETSTASFPSGHAAHSVAYVAMAVAIGRAFGSAVRGAALVVTAVVLAVTVALTRVYLRAHHLSDVLAGAGLAAVIFSALGIAALVVAHVRNTPEAAPAPGEAAAHDDP
jgi:membrane protein DedA with SNARE-associated domain/membrane-associated phospholipid phosphatase